MQMGRMFKYLLIITILTTSFVYSASDKVLHFTISGIMGGGVESFLYRKTELGTTARIALGTGIAFLPGLGKEVLDSSKKNNKFSKSDLAYDFAGSLFGALASAYLNEKISMKVVEKEASISWSNPF